MKNRGRCALPMLGLVGSLAMTGVAMAANTSTTGTNAASNTPQISSQKKADNPQAVLFADNGTVIHPTENIQVDSAGKLHMATSEPAWMNDQGLYMTDGRKLKQYKPGVISYMNDASPYVVLAIQMPGASMFMNPKQAINNPTLVVPAGRQVIFKVMNFSNGYPGTFTVVRKGPPYPEFIQPQDEGVVFNSGWIDRTPMSGAYSPYRTVAYTFNKPGKYYYLSMQPGNAQGGQWGEIEVKSAKGGA